MCIGEKDVKWASHDEVVTLIKNAGDALSLKLVTPMDRNYLKVSVVSSLVFFFFIHIQTQFIRFTRKYTL